MGILFFTYKNVLHPFPLELFPFPLIAQNYSNSPGNPVEMGIPIPVHTSGPVERVYAVQRHLSTAEPARMCDTTRGRQTLRSAAMPPRSTNPNEQPTSSRCIATRLQRAIVGVRFCTDKRTAMHFWIIRSPVRFLATAAASTVMGDHYRAAEKGT